jgi:hypothetical protein
VDQSLEHARFVRQAADRIRIERLFDDHRIPTTAAAPCDEHMVVLIENLVGWGHGVVVRE